MKIVDRIEDHLYCHRRLAIVYSFICAMVLVNLVGCAFGGGKEVNTVIFVEPGGVCKIATDEKIEVWVTTKDKDGKDKEVVVKKNLAGNICMPKSVYESLRQSFIDYQSLNQQMADAASKDPLFADMLKKKGFIK